MKIVLALGVTLLLAAFAVFAAAAQDRITVAAARFLESSGFLSFISARAGTDAGLDIQWMPADDEQVAQLARECGVDAILVSDPEAEEALVRDSIGALRLRVMAAGPGRQVDAVALNPAACPGARLNPALKFLRWITSEPTQKAIADFSPQGAPAYRPDAGGPP